MQFIADGPDIPVEVLQAQEEGRLVLFCGSGVSAPAGLPDFPGLVDRVRCELGADLTPPEADALEHKFYDRVLGLMEGKGRFKPAQLRSAVAKILQPPTDPDLRTHNALLDLARDRSGRVRLVTTNFDRLFEAADAKLPQASAPMLPVPKLHKWNSLVYLHGRLDDSDPEGKHLVLTSGDFGVAYLVERWASRFVSELFNHATVLFVGYGINDPVMRYLVDAIAAERHEDSRLQEAYAMAEYGPEQRDAERDAWEAKSITPIMYESADDHAALHGTLVAWADAWKGGLSSKRNIVATTGLRKPAALGREEIELFCWALKHPSGSMARELAKMGSVVDETWLAVFDREGLVSGPYGEHSAADAPLVDDGRATDQPPALDAVRSGMGWWLSELIAKPSVAQWIVSKGGRLHPQLRRFVRHKLGATPSLPPALRKVWAALAGSVPLQGSEDAYDRLGFYRRVGSEPWSEALRVDLLRALSPCLSIRRAWGSAWPTDDDDDISQDEEGLRVSSILSFDCEIEAGGAWKMMLEQLRGRGDWGEILADIAFDLASLLRRALDLQAMLEGASAESDPSYIDQPSIAPHEQNKHFHGWTALIELNRDAVEHLATQNPGRARALIAVWMDSPYPVFRRLVLHATGLDGAVESESVMKALMAAPQNWLWSSSVQVELFASLSRLWPTLAEIPRRELLELILSGPPRKMFRPDLTEHEWHNLRDHSIWELLRRFAMVEPALEGEPAERLRLLEEQHPAWRLTGDPRDDFPYWTEARWGHETDFSAEELLARNDDDLVRILIEHQAHREGLADAWGAAAKLVPGRAVVIHGRLLDEDYFGVPIWYAGLSAFREMEEDEQLRRDALALLLRLPEDLSSEGEIPRALADAIRALADGLAEEIRTDLCSLWDRQFVASLALEPMDREGRVTAAINHPLGVLAEALLNMLRSRELVRNGGIPEDVRGRMEQIVEAPSPAGPMGRVLLASRLPLLHFVASDWTCEHLIPFFSWDDPIEASGAWQGYLWSPSLRPSLWAVLKEHFLATFGHVEELGESARNLATLLAVVAVEGEDPPSSDQARQCLKKIRAEGRGWAARWIENRLEGAETQAAHLWRDRIGPWLTEAWPREADLQGQVVSEDLARSAALAGDAFAEAVEAILPLIGPIDDASIILDRLGDSGLVASEPASCLELVDTLAGAAPPGGSGDLRTFLERVRQADPALENTAAYRRLETIALEQGS